MMTRLLPTFFTENFGNVSCAESLKQAGAIMTVARSRIIFFIIYITEKGLDSFTVACKDNGGLKESRRLTSLLAEIYCPASHHYESAIYCFRPGTNYSLSYPRCHKTISRCTQNLSGRLCSYKLHS